MTNIYFYNRFNPKMLNGKAHTAIWKGKISLFLDNNLLKLNFIVQETSKNRKWSYFLAKIWKIYEYSWKDMNKSQFWFSEWFELVCWNLYRVHFFFTLACLTLKLNFSFEKWNLEWVWKICLQCQLYVKHKCNSIQARQDKTVAFLTTLKV